MCDKAHINALPLCKESWYIFPAEAVTHTSDPLHAELAADVSDGRGDYGINLGSRMPRAPLGQIKGALWRTDGNGIALEEIGEDD